MSTTVANRIARTFEQLRAAHRAAFIPFFVAGDPDIPTTAELIKAAANSGADLIEVGIPFSDPIADGPVIQAAYYRALERGFRVAQLFEMTRKLRADGLQTPLICMVSYTLVFKRSLSEFLSSCKGAGVDGLIIPDLPAGYEGDAVAEAERAGIDLIFLVAPTTPPERRALIAQRSRGFIYYISVTGITGARTELPPDLKANIDDMRSRTSLPVCVGFGISQPEQAAAVGKIADGVIVGSALIKRTEEAAKKGLSGNELIRYVDSLTAELAVSAHS